MHAGAAIFNRLQPPSQTTASSNYMMSQAGLEVLSQAGLEVVEDLQEQAQDYLETETVLSQSSLQTNADDRAKKLASLIKTKCSDVTIEPDIEPQAPRLSTASVLSRQLAHDILVRNRRSTLALKNHGEGVPKLLRSTLLNRKVSDPSNWIFSDEEKSQAMKEAVECGMVDLAEVLLDMGLDTNAVTGTAKSRILRRQSVTSTPINYISTAASKNNVDMVNLLASRGASSESLEDALDKAVRQNLPKVVESILRFKTNPNAMSGTIFGSAVTSQKPILVRLLLRARIKVHEKYLTENLPRAVAQGQTEIVSLLITHGADVNYDDAAALRKAVQDQRVDLVLVIMKGKPTTKAVSSVFNDAFSVNSVITPSERKLLLEILLCAGAQGDCVAETLVQVVRGGEKNLANLLVKYGASLHYQRAKSLRIAITAGDSKLVKILLLGEVSPRCVIDRFDDIRRPFVKDRTHEMMSMLLSKAKAAAGLPLDKALVVSVEQRLISITELLLNHKASVNYNDAQALQICASRGDLETLKLLLNKGRPHQNLMQHVLPQITSGPHRLRYYMTKSIVDAAQPIGIPTPVLDAALMEVVDSPSELVDLDLVNLVLNAGANVNCLHGRCLQLATQRGCLELLELLVRHNPEPASVSLAIAKAVRLKQPALRCRAATILLDHGAQGPEVSGALDDALEERRIDEELVHLLLTKADINYRGGRLLHKVVVSLSPSMVSSVIDFNKPEQAALIAALPAVLDPCTKDRQAKLSSLLQAGTDRKALDSALIQEINNGAAYDFTIVKMLMDHGASCSHDSGKAIELAMLLKNVVLLEYLIGSKPGHRILTSMLPAAMNEVGVRSRYKFVSMLLRSGAKGDQINRSLITEVHRSSGCSLRIIELLMEHGARVDFSNADAIKHVVSQPLHIDILKALVQGKGAPDILTSLIPLAMVHEQDVRLQLLPVLFSSGASGAGVNAALIEAVSEGPASQPTIDLLLKNKASADFENGRAIKLAVANGYDSILECLLNHSHDPKHRSDAIEMTMRANSFNLPRRLSSVRLLTNAGVAKNATIHNALIQAVQEQDHSLTQCLLESHADPNFESGKSVIIATEQADIKSLVLLATAKPQRKIYSEAFKVIADDQKMKNVDSRLLLRVRKHLLQHGAAGQSVDQKFLDYMTSRDPLQIELSDFVLACGSALNVDFKAGKILCIAVQNNDHRLVKILLSREPNESTLSSAFYSLLESDVAENSLLAMVDLFMKQSGDRKYIYFEEDKPSRNPLYLALHRHPDKSNLLLSLLGNGCPADARFTWSFTPDHGVEEVSALLWLLCQADPKLDTGVIKALLKHGADSNFRTAMSSVSPLIVAATVSPGNIVLQLLEAQADPNTEDNSHGTPLYYATRAGKLEIMKLLLEHEADPDDESLHIACQNLNSSAAKLLLDHGASINFPGINLTDSRTPLENLCCKADANRKAADLKVMLKILAKAKPNLKKLSQGKSVVVQAMDNLSPFVMTKALLAAFPTLCETLNEDHNIYRSSNGFCYSPTMYVRRFKCAQSPRSNLDRQQSCCELSDCCALQLAEALCVFGCEDRYWDAQKGANQPVGACGLPPNILAAVEEAENTRKRHEEEIRVRQTEEQRRVEEEARLDKEARAVQRREQERLNVIAEGERKIAAAIRARQQEEERAEARQREAEETEAREKETREKRAFDKRRNELNILEDDKERYAQRKDHRMVATMQKQLKIQNDGLKQKQKIIQSATELAREMRDQVPIGRILGEIGDQEEQLHYIHGRPNLLDAIDNGGRI